MYMYSVRNETRGPGARLGTQLQFVNELQGVVGRVGREKSYSTDV